SHRVFFVSSTKASLEKTRYDIYTLKMLRKKETSRNNFVIIKREGGVKISWGRYGNLPKWKSYGKKYPQEFRT
ncbi:MAG: hypothetical protein IKM04_01740, partial [Clostridia bacterium]|nr:hypothetical protein [Clostridia bacterium]